MLIRSFPYASNPVDHHHRHVVLYSLLYAAKSNTDQDSHYRSHSNITQGHTGQTTEFQLNANHIDDREHDLLPLLRTASPSCSRHGGTEIEKANESTRRGHSVIIEWWCLGFFFFCLFLSCPPPSEGVVGNERPPLKSALEIKWDLTGILVTYSNANSTVYSTNMLHTN